MKRLALPGTELTGDRAALVIALIESRCNPDCRPPIEVIRRAKTVGRELFDSDFFASGMSWYAFYEHPVIKNRSRVHLVPNDDLLTFLRDRIHPERGEGLDVTLTPETDPARILICNHDGEMFLLAAEP